MSRVHLLPDQVANQIAAGEVVERPASVIKELVENSLDAGATKISVSFKGNGAAFMQVEDDGCGLSHDDALLALERHATSKIREADDLNRIMTMGFRGEALPSIASVSRFLLQTREKDAESGTEILINGGKIAHVRDCGMPPGTRITVSNLFSTVPARRKFLKSDATESAHIVHQTRLCALANPAVAFELTDSGRCLFQTPSCDSLQPRIAEIYGKSQENALLQLDATEGDMRLHGFIGKPGYAKASRHEMLLFVNNRPVESRTLGYALVESYYGHIPKGRYPVAYLFLEMSPELLDVNVHPAKREVRFRAEAQVRGFAVRSILVTLRKSLEETSAALSQEALAKPTPSDLNRFRQESPRSSAAVAAAPRARIVDTSSQVTKSGLSVPEESVSVDVAAVASPPATQDKPELRPKHESQVDHAWRFIGWGQRDFALFETEAGIVLLHVRAAQERVWHERLMREFASKATESQQLLMPLPLEFDPVSAAIIEENLDFLASHGFDAAPFGRNFFRIAASPSWVDEQEIESFFRDAIALLRQGKAPGREADLARLAVRRAIRFSQKPSEEEFDNILRELFACQNPLADIDGRPTFIEISRGELSRRFQRNAAQSREDLL